MPTFSRICPRSRESPSKPLTDDWVGTSKIRVTARHWYIHNRICSSVCFSQIVGPKGWDPLESGPQASVVKKSSVSFHHASGCMGLRTWLLAPCPCGEESCWFVDTCVGAEFPLFSRVRSFAGPTCTSVWFSTKKHCHCRLRYHVTKQLFQLTPCDHPDQTDIQVKQKAPTPQHKSSPIYILVWRRFEVSGSNHKMLMLQTYKLIFKADIKWLRFLRKYHLLMLGISSTVETSDCWPAKW